MKRFSVLLSILLVSVFIFSMAADLIAQDVIWVAGYLRKDGTYVKGHYKTKPDGNPYNNFSYPGNYNPNTGKVTPGNQSTYLRNYYEKSGKSSYVKPLVLPSLELKPLVLPSLELKPLVLPSLELKPLVLPSLELEPLYPYGTDDE